MKRARAKHSILPPSKFSLVQITRQRVRPEMNVQILEKCPACDGTGQIRPSILLTDDIENNLSYLIREQNEKKLSLVVHPFQVMDVTLKNYMDLQPGQAIELIENLMVEVKAVDGTFVSLFHNESLGEWNDWNGWRGVFEHMLEKDKKLENEPS